MSSLPTPEKTSQAPTPHTQENTQAALTLAAIGVVFGDIGTSPLYTLKEAFNGAYPVPPTPDNVYGLLSLVFWALTLIVTFKYVLFITRADNHREGGIIALAALALRALPDGRTARLVSLLAIFGAALFYADGMITPAISVLSAVEGLEIATPAFSALVVPISLIVLIGLFLMQQKGSTQVGAIFGPIMLCWFLVLAALGIKGILQHPQILYSINPIWGARFFINQPLLAWLSLGAVVLAITGGEALYADMGHFGRPPIARAWLYLIFPALYLNYMGQGAQILLDPSHVNNPFYMLVPPALLYPMVALATVATIIASQAVISGAFSLTSQAILLGYAPRMKIVHTSEKTIGQIYLPSINWALMGAVIALIIGFKSSSALASAYGIAVTLTMLTTSILAIILARHLWKWSWIKIILVMTVFILVEVAFLSANLVKISSGGWLPLLIGIMIFTIMTTWRTGRNLVQKEIHASEKIPTDFFIQNLTINPPVRVEGTAVFMSSSPDGIPRTLLHNLIHNKVLHEHIILLTVITTDTPRVCDQERIQHIALEQGFSRMKISYGFMESPNIPAALELHYKQEKRMFNLMEISFFLGRETLISTVGSGMATWREKLFIVLFRNADSAADYFRIPSNRVVELGAQIEF